MNDGTTPLVLAARLAEEGMVEELIHCHADINAVDDHGEPTLHMFTLLLWNVLCLYCSLNTVNEVHTVARIDNAVLVWGIMLVSW